MSVSFTPPQLSPAGICFEIVRVRTARKRELLTTLDGTSRRLAPIDWVICAVACIGFAFDTYELLVLTLTVQPALTEFLAAKPGSAEFNHWIGLMFYVPAIAGGVFGLLGGYLIDRFGRRRVLFWSILLFCFSALATAYCSQRPAIAVLPLRHFRRCLRRVRCGHCLAGRNVSRAQAAGNDSRIYAGVCVHRRDPDEWRELPKPLDRSAASGDSRRPRSVALHDSVGNSPGYSAACVRPFLPESPIWQKKREEGTPATPQHPGIISPGIPQDRAARAAS